MKTTTATSTTTSILSEDARHKLQQRRRTTTSVAAAKENNGLTGMLHRFSLFGGAEQEEKQPDEDGNWSFWGASVSLVESTPPPATANQLKQDLFERSSHSRSGHKTMLIVEDAVEAFWSARKTPDKAARTITTFMRQASLILKQDHELLEYLKQDLEFAREDLRQELEDIRANTEVAKQMARLQLEREFKEQSFESEAEQHVVEMDQLTQEIAQEKLQGMELKEQIRQLEQENSQLATVDPEKEKDYAALEKQVARLEGYQQQLTKFQTEHQTDCQETQRRINLYKQAKENRRDQRKRCEKYMDRIIHMTQLRLGQPGQNLVKYMKHRKRHNQNQHESKTAIPKRKSEPSLPLRQRSERGTSSSSTKKRDMVRKQHSFHGNTEKEKKEGEDPHDSPIGRHSNSSRGSKAFRARASSKSRSSSRTRSSSKSMDPSSGHGGNHKKSRSSIRSRSKSSSDYAIDNTGNDSNKKSQPENNPPPNDNSSSISASPTASSNTNNEADTAQKERQPANSSENAPAYTQASTDSELSSFNHGASASATNGTNQKKENTNPGDVVAPSGDKDNPPPSPG